MAIVAGAIELDANLRELAKRAASPAENVRALMQGAVIVERAAKENVKGQGLIDTGNLRASIGSIPDLGSVAVLIGPQGVEYAAIHEFGGDVHPTVTPQMRKWAWAMHFKTGDEKYKGMALTKKGHLDIHIPARPYLRPALDENKDQILAQIAQAIWRLIEGAV